MEPLRGGDLGEIVDADPAKNWKTWEHAVLRMNSGQMPPPNKDRPSSEEYHKMLPKDESSHGFDNITVGKLSPTLLNRYLVAAKKISRIAVGISYDSPDLRVVRIPADRSQKEHVEGLPLGTRGGVLFEHTFPVAGEYEFEIRLARDRNGFWLIVQKRSRESILSFASCSSSSCILLPIPLLFP